MLHDKFERQKRFYAMVTEQLSGTTNLSEKQQLAWLKEYLICIIRELMEVLDEVPWKLHVYDEKIIDREKLLEELIDVQKFVWNLFNVFDFSFDDFCVAFDKKSDRVEIKWRKFLDDV